MASRGLAWKALRWKPKPSLKIKMANAIFWICLGIFKEYGMKNIFLGKKLLNFCAFQGRKLTLSASVWKTIVIFIFSIDCLIELKFCKDSQFFFSKKCWKFQASILKNKKVLFLEKKFFKPLSILKQKSFVYRPNFQ